ncbi:GMP synthase (glutamine-hydrolyzing) [Puccinia graminis f. sp. tritici]|uniref:GMP synthase [glutamine-hydrolyzing] n=1 Tax=Puccinia graminis f. sp. tritici TaxID=56615 RepID=A0A5B0LXQ7_PUCGR|nr:GMP synthase (glutamine-hydrolyzing) [Puccinia graminis f. sp. tritici]KAA1104267.1 GMP synthase (glutamine-hydrolyzing) [Puccinia graminis f. sp. tritici]
MRDVLLCPEGLAKSGYIGFQSTHIFSRHPSYSDLSSKISLFFLSIHFIYKIFTTFTTKMSTASTIATDAAVVPLTDLAQSYDTILILDFGSQYSHLITRRCRELNVYCEMLPCTFKVSQLKWRPKGIILSGSPYSVYEADSPRVDPEVFELGVPVFGICYGLQEISRSFGGKVIACDHKEYGSAMLDVCKAENIEGGKNVLFDGLGAQVQVWMSHGDRLDSLPDNFQILATTSSAPYAAIAHKSKPIYGVQFHPEVTHSTNGKQIIEKFVIGVCQCKPDWTMATFIDKEIARIRSVVGPDDQVIGAVSGGVDSSVAAKLMNEAIGHRFHAIMVDNGLLRMDEAQQVQQMLKVDLGVNLTVVDASQTFLDVLKDVEDPETKRKLIGNTFIHVFEAEAARIEAQQARQATKTHEGTIKFLLQGTLYPDVIESISFKGPSATIKTHHNVGGLLDNMKLKLIEPLRELFKDEVRALGKLLHIPSNLTNRHPFPGPGLAIRILGPVNKAQLDIARKADQIFLQEIRKESGLYEQISQAFAVLLPVRAVGVQGDKRTYEQVIVLRAVKTEDFMTADWFDFPPHVLRAASSRITNEVAGVNRVTYDISSKPPGTVEWL